MNRKKLGQVIINLILLVVISVSVQRSTYDLTDPVEKVRRYTRWQEFDYVSWMADALALKISFGAVNLPNYLGEASQLQVVFDYLALLQKTDTVSEQISIIYSDPAVQDPKSKAAGLLAEQADLTARISQLQPMAEVVLQSQISTVAADLGLSLGGQLIPPLLYHVTPLPMALIVSPRNVIQQVADISLQPDPPLTYITRLEEQVTRGLDVSALVVPVGGVGVYPTMVTATTDLNWLVETVAHEWIHNYLTLRPLGALYYSTPEMRTINETTANIAGTEIGTAVIRRFYPERASAPEPVQTSPSPATPPSGPPKFDFRAEMHTTRLTADALLAEGKIDQAEAYMESRRQFFYDHGYLIRKLNQAYFAFYGSYADQPGGPAGTDPVGAAVRLLRSESISLSDFIGRIAWVTSYPALQKITAGS